MKHGKEKREEPLAVLFWEAKTKLTMGAESDE